MVLNLTQHLSFFCKSVANITASRLNDPASGLVIKTRGWIIQSNKTGPGFSQNLLKRVKVVEDNYNFMVIQDFHAKPQAIIEIEV